MAMNSVEPAPLKWTTQLTVAPETRSPKLLGDKIVLPQTALEELLAAVTVTVVSDGQTSSSFDPFNPYSIAAERDSRSRIIERHQNLPQPLTFRIVNPENGSVVYAGIREFSASNGEIGLSPFLRDALGLKVNGEGSNSLTIHAQQLPKGTSVRFRPLEAGYDPDDWKALLERQLRNTFTTITKGEILQIQSGREEYRFLVDKIEPDGDGICIIDTDLEVDIEALNEDQARETLKRRQANNRKSQTDGRGTVGGIVAVGESNSGQVLPGEYVDYELIAWDRSMGLDIELQLAEPDRADIFVSPLRSTQRRRPREDEHVFFDVSEHASRTKRIRIDHNNHEVERSEAVYISIYGNMLQQLESSSAVLFSLSVQSLEVEPSSPFKDQAIPSHAPDEVPCKNCLQWVPQRTMMLHENFCYRNNILCPQCQEVFQKSSNEWKEHWHCPHDKAQGNSVESQHRHNSFFHIPEICKGCGYAAKNMSDLAAHRTSYCPNKLILCQFCHLLVPQRGPDDLDPTDPEVILSNLTPHELSDGNTTTDCHMCGKIVRLRDMVIHLRHHDLDRLTRPAPKLCRNMNCGRTIDGVGPNGIIKRSQTNGNELGLCDTCFGPLYNSSFDPEHRALRRRLERRYLTQMLTGCGKSWCRNTYCKTGRSHLESGNGVPVTSKGALEAIGPFLVELLNSRNPLHFCTDEQSQTRKVMAEVLSRQENGTTGYNLPWTVAALEASSDDLQKALEWLHNWAPRKDET